MRRFDEVLSEKSSKN